MNIDYALLDNLSAEHGDSFYLLDEKLFETNYEQLLSAFCSYYGRTKIAYSYKTNYLPSLCRIVQGLGGCAEVVSEMELYLADKLAVPGENIYFNGPWKKRQHVERLMLSGGHVNTDGFYEIRMLGEIAAAHPDVQFSAGLRIAGDIGQDEPSRFGFDAANGDLKKAFDEIDKIPNMRVSGLHLHLPFRMPETFEKRIDALADILEEFSGYTFDYISLGGGYMGEIPGSMRREFSFEPPTYDDYARIVAGGFADIIKKRGDDGRTVLIIEPGSAIAANAMKLVTRVINIKKSRDRFIATLSGSTYQTNPSVKDVKRSLCVYSPADATGSERPVFGGLCMAGYTCIEGDYLCRGYSGPLAEGDFVVFDNVGSYSVVMKPPFILPDVAVIADTGEAVVCRIPAQTSEEVFGRLLAPGSFSDGALYQAAGRGS